jgi:Holliday junction DNA helicase RuvA
VAILSFASVDQLQTAILGEDTALLSKVPGVGRKTAARIVLELRGKLTAAVGVGTRAGVPADPATSEVLEALQALGYTSAEALQAVQALGEETRDLTPEQRVFAALRQMGQGR